MDSNIQKLIRLCKSMGTLGLELLLQEFPVLRHDANYQYTKRWETRYNYEHAAKWIEWKDKIPPLRFDSDWKIHMQPPWGSAMVRFLVNGHSVYLDCDASLGCVGEPYWEIYLNGETYRFMMNETEELYEILSAHLRRE